MSSVSRNCLGFMKAAKWFNVLRAVNVGEPQSQKPTETGTETVETETASGIMALPTIRQLVKALLTNFCVETEPKKVTE